MIEYNLINNSHYGLKIRTSASHVLEDATHLYPPLPFHNGYNGLEKLYYSDERKYNIMVYELCRPVFPSL